MYFNKTHITALWIVDPAYRLTLCYFEILYMVHIPYV